MRAGFVGCGSNSNYHIRFAKEYKGIEIVGIADKDPGKLADCSRLHGIRGVFSSVEELVKEGKPDAVHILTPPQTHYSVAKEAIQLGCNVLVEKPLALNRQDSESLFELAQKNNVKLCTMHNHLFDPCMVEARTLIEQGRAGSIINVESYYGLNTQIDTFKKYPLPNVLPWVYSLPGGVFHDFMPHPLYVALKYTGRPLEVMVMEKSFGTFPQNISDELRVLIEGENCLGTVTISFASKPHLHFLRIYGTKMVITVDFNTMSTVSHPVSSLPKAAQKAVFNLGHSRQLASRTISNVWNFGRGKLKPYQGMEVLIHQFYDHVAGKGRSPVSKEEALLVIESMDEICRKIENKHLNFAPIISELPLEGAQDRLRILVTGGTGFLGRRLVDELLTKGYRVRVLARKLSRIQSLDMRSVEILFGDVADSESMEPAFEGVDVVVHAAAGTSGAPEDGETATIQGTRNVLQLCSKYSIKKLVYISSCSIYGVAEMQTGARVHESSPKEKYPEKRGHYSYAKLEAEKLITEAMGNSAFAIVCLRPGTIWGPGGEYYTPVMGVSILDKVFMVIGNGKLELPLVYIDNLVDAVILSVEKKEADNQVFNVVDPERINKRTYMEKIVKLIYPKSFAVFVPYVLISALTAGLEILFKLLRRENPPLTRYRLKSSQRPVVFDSSRISDLLEWKPRTSMSHALKLCVEYSLNAQR